MLALIIAPAVVAIRLRRRRPPDEVLPHPGHGVQDHGSYCPKSDGPSARRQCKRALSGASAVGGFARIGRDFVARFLGGA
jgi:hypothetical protein